MLRIGIVGCGRAASAHVGRLRALPDVQVVGLADQDLSASQELASTFSESAPEVFSSLSELLTKLAPGAVSIFTPHRSHYTLAMQALQVGCHLFVEKPLTTNAQEAADIANLARARGRVVGVGHQYRLRPSLAEARRLLSEGAIGPIRMISAQMAAPWLAQHSGPADSWRLDPKAGGTGILSDAGDHLLDVLLWTAGQPASEVAAFQSRTDSGLDVVSAVALRLADGTPATLALSAVSPDTQFELTYFGENGLIRASDLAVEIKPAGGTTEIKNLPADSTSIDADFVQAVASNGSPCCPVDQALDTVRLLEAIVRSGASGQVVRVA